MRTSLSAATGIEQLLGIELPVIQAPMAGVQDAALAAAISNAGGLGSLPGALLNSAALEAELHRLTAMTDKPFNVNFFCHETPVVSQEQQRVWQQSLAVYFKELGIASFAGQPGQRGRGDRIGARHTVCAWRRLLLGADGFGPAGGGGRHRRGIVRSLRIGCARVA